MRKTKGKAKSHVFVSRTGLVNTAKLIKAKWVEGMGCGKHTNHTIASPPSPLTPANHSRWLKSRRSTKAIGGKFIPHHRKSGEAAWKANWMWIYGCWGYSWTLVEERWGNRLEAFKLSCYQAEVNCKVKFSHTQLKVLDLIVQSGSFSFLSSTQTLLTSANCPSLSSNHNHVSLSHSRRSILLRHESSRSQFRES